MVPMTYDLDLGFEAHQRISASIDPLKSGTVRGRLIAKNSENIRVL